MSPPTAAPAPLPLDRPMRTTAQQAASRANGARSRGPATPEGRRRCRRNALRHGMSGAGVVLPEALEQEARAEADAYARVLHPRSALERRLVETAALANVRWSWLARAANERTIDQVRSAVERWDARRAAEVAAAAAPLEAPNGQDPAAAVAVLRRMAEGCDWLADAWLDLRDALETSGGWSGPQSARAARLLGRAVPGPRDEDNAFWRAFWAAVRACRSAMAPRVGRREPGGEGSCVTADGSWVMPSGPSPIAPQSSPIAHVPSPPTPNDDLAYLIDVCQAQIDELVERGDRLWEQIDGPSRAEAPGRALFDDSPEGARLARYLADAERAGRRALAELRRLQRAPVQAAAMPVHAAESVAPAPELADGDTPTAAAGPAPAPSEVDFRSPDTVDPASDAADSAPDVSRVESATPRRETNLAPGVPTVPAPCPAAPDGRPDFPDPVVWAA
jgi:hypothetical protein